MNVTLSVGEFAALVGLCGGMAGVLLSLGIPWLVRVICNMENGAS